MQLMNGALLLKTNFFSPNALLFALLAAVAIAAVLLGSSKSLAPNFFFTNSNISFHNNIRIAKIT